MVFQSAFLFAVASVVPVVGAHLAAATVNQSAQRASRKGTPAGGAEPASSPAVLGQLKDTLQNVLRGVEDEGHNFAVFAEQRRKWCAQGLQNWSALANASHDELQSLRSDLEEREAAVEEMNATAQHAHANIALVQHTIKQATSLLETSQSQDNGQRQQLQELLVDRKAVLSALQSEFQALSPTVARLQADAAEAQRRVESRQEAVEAVGVFTEALRNSCSIAVEREDDRAALRLTVSTALHDALQALNQVGIPKKQLPSQGSAPHSAESPELTDSSDKAQQALEAFEKEEEKEDAEDAAVETDISFVQVASISAKGRHHDFPDNSHVADAEADLPTIDELVARMNAGSEADSAKKATESPQHAEWCSRERVRNNFAMTFMQDLSAQMTTESQLHEDMGAQLGKEVTQLQSEHESIQNVSSSAAWSVSEDERLATTEAHDGELAVKILSQAAAVFAELCAPGGPLQNDEAAARAAQALQNASRAFVAVGAAKSKTSNSSSDMMQQLAEAAEDAAQSIRREILLLQKQQKRHALQKGLCDQRHGQYNNQANEAADYLKQLENECGSTADTPSQQRRKVELRALQDSKRVLQGMNPVRSNRPGGRHGSLRGSAASEEEGAVTSASKEVPGALAGATSTAQRSELSPLERAAAEMGVQMDG